MLKESRNLTSAAKLFGQFGDDTARITKEIGKKNAARFTSMFDRNLTAAQAGNPFDQTFMDFMYPKVERMFRNKQLSSQDFRRIYSKSKLFDLAKNTILRRNEDIGLYRALRPRFYSRAEKREALQYLRGLRKHTDLSEKVSNKLENLDRVIKDGQRYASVYGPPGPQWERGLPDTTSFARSKGFLSREDLLRQAKKENVILNKNDLHEPFYVNKGTALESSQAIPKSPWQRDITSAVDNELKYSAFYAADTKKMLQKAPRSIQRAKAIVEGQNILQPGTRANRFFTKLQQSNSPGIKQLLSDNALDEAIQGTNAFYNVRGNYIAVNPKPFRFRNRDILNPAATEAHERGHSFAHSLPEAEHRAVAKDLFTKLRRAADRYNLDIPFNSQRLMQEAFADGYAALKLGKIDPFNTRLNHVFYKAKLEKTDPRTYRTLIRNLKKINNAKDLDDVTKQMLTHLQINYGVNIFKNWK